MSTSPEGCFGSGSRRIRLLHTSANGQPAAASYRPDALGNPRADGLWVFTVVDGRFSRAVKFHDPALVTAAGLPVTVANGVG